MHVMDVPQLAERLGCVLFMRNFGANIAQIRSLVGLMDAAAAALRSSAAFKALLQTILAVGNQMNSGTTKGAAQVRAPRMHAAHDPAPHAWPGVRCAHREWGVRCSCHFWCAVLPASPPTVPL